MITDLQKRIAQKRANGEGGFSLIELIVVVVILGILVAIAIPTYGNIQTTSRQNATATAASNAGMALTSKLAAGEITTQSAAKTFLENMSSGDITVTECSNLGVSNNPQPHAGVAQNTNPDNLCVLAYNKNLTKVNSGAWVGSITHNASGKTIGNSFVK